MSTDKDTVYAAFHWHKGGELDWVILFSTKEAAVGYCDQYSTGHIWWGDKSQSYFGGTLDDTPDCYEITEMPIWDEVR